jgi:hypothetical protein
MFVVWCKPDTSAIRAGGGDFLRRAAGHLANGADSASDPAAQHVAGAFPNLRTIKPLAILYSRLPVFRAPRVVCEREDDDSVLVRAIHEGERKFSDEYSTSICCSGRTGER